jgi:pyruvate formate lyase activating enzyme
VETAIKRKCKSISHSINEPVVFYEYMYEIARLAKKAGLLTLFHSNGTLSPLPLKELLKVMDGVTIDLKGFSEKFYKEISSASLEPVLNTLKIIKESGTHLEIVYLVIPTLNDNMEEIRECCKWIKDSLGPYVPLHFTRFFPHYKLKNLPPTPINTLEEARNIALREGLYYVYIGNVPGHEANNTYCHGCKKMIIHRIGYTTIKTNILNGRCRFCKSKIPGIF